MTTTTSWKMVGDGEGTLVVESREDSISDDELVVRGEAADAAPMATSAKQFNFARHWRKKIAPVLADPTVMRALTVGMKLHDIHYEEGDPPWRFGRGPWNGQRARQGCLSWYQPWGRCHHIAPFCWALGRKLYPELNWGFITGDYHTVVVGWLGDWREPQWVMDILLFRDKTADESLEFARSKEWSFYPSLGRYAASFCDNPESAFEIYCEHFGEMNEEE